MDGQRKAQAISSCGNTNPCLNSQMIREKLVYYTCIYLCTVAIISYWLSNAVRRVCVERERGLNGSNCFAILSIHTTETAWKEVNLKI